MTCCFQCPIEIFADYPSLKLLPIATEKKMNRLKDREDKELKCIFKN